MKIMMIIIDDGSNEEGTRIQASVMLKHYVRCMALSLEDEDMLKSHIVDSIARYI